MSYRKILLVGSIVMALVGAGGGALCQTAPVCQSLGFVCSQPNPPINGACGLANGGTFPAAPTADLCATGTPSSVVGTGPWSWSCAGTNGGTTAMCAALKTATPPPPPTQGRAFFEDFRTAASLDRFDRGWSGEWNAGALFGQARNDWHADHDMNCADPNTTSRVIHLESAEQAAQAAFFHCTPGADQNKAHMMTTVNTEGYVSVWFSPKQVFTNVSKVCWDQNITNLGGGKWVIVNFLKPAEYVGKTDLGYTSPDFPNNGGPSSPAGAAQNGVKLFGGFKIYNNGQVWTSEGASSVSVADKAARYKHCVIDNGNGTVTTTVAQPNGATNSATTAGVIPQGDIRVVFVDDNYNPDKHFSVSEEKPADSSGLYTWHWDNIEIFQR